MNVNDVAKAILARSSGMSQLKLHKLLYYCQALSLLWFSKPMFSEPIEAWANGPVVPDLWREHRYESWIEASDVAGDETRLSEPQIGCVDAVLKAFGSLAGNELSALTHGEEPWIVARSGLRPGQSGRTGIDLVVMKQFYTRAWGKAT